MNIFTTTPLEPLMASRFQLACYDKRNNILNINSNNIVSWTISNDIIMFTINNYITECVEPTEIAKTCNLSIGFEDPTGKIVRLLNLSLKNINYLLEGDFSKDEILQYKCEAQIGDMSLK